MSMTRVLGGGGGGGGEKKRERDMFDVTRTTQFDVGYTVQLQDKRQL